MKVKAAVDAKQMDKVLSAMKEPVSPATEKHADIYNEKDPIYRLDDGSFLLFSRIKQDFWNGPGILQVYAPWCPYCQDEVDNVIDAANNGSVYVLDGAANPLFRFAQGVKGYPTFFKITEDGLVGEIISGGMKEAAEFLKSLEKASTSGCSM
jgi:hypothetical protein